MEIGCTSGISEMLLQSSDGAIHLLPAVPDALSIGYVGGLKARGDFEVVSLEWKDKNLVVATIKSNLGENLRLRVPNAIELIGTGTLKKAEGENPNPLFYVPETATPIISKEATLENLKLESTFLYDLETEKGKTYTFTFKK